MRVGASRSIRATAASGSSSGSVNRIGAGSAPAIGAPASASGKVSPVAT